MGHSIGAKIIMEYLSDYSYMSFFNPLGVILIDILPIDYIKNDVNKEEIIILKSANK